MAAAAMRMQQSRKAPAQVAPEAAERLRALGYVSGSAPAAVDDPKAPESCQADRVMDDVRACASANCSAGNAAAAAAVLRTLAERHPQAHDLSDDVCPGAEGSRARAAKPWRSTKPRSEMAGDAALFHDLAVAAREAGDAAEASRAEAGRACARLRQRDGAQWPRAAARRRRPACRGRGGVRESRRKRIRPTPRTGRTSETRDVR